MGKVIWHIHRSLRRSWFSTMTWLTVTEYLCHKWLRICSVCRNHNTVISSFMIYHQVCSNSNTTSGTGTTYPFGAPGFTPSLVCVFSVMFCKSLFVLLYFFFWQLYLLSVSVRFLITPLVSSNFLQGKYVCTFFQLILNIRFQYCHKFICFVWAYLCTC